MSCGACAVFFRNKNRAKKCVLLLLTARGLGSRFPLRRSPFGALQRSVESGSQ